MGVPILEPGGIEGLWRAYERMTLPPSASPEDRARQRHAFFHGAIGTFDLVTGDAADPGEHPARRLARRIEVIEALHRELTMFSVELIGGHA